MSNTVNHLTASVTCSCSYAVCMLKQQNSIACDIFFIAFNVLLSEIQQQQKRSGLKGYSPKKKKKKKKKGNNLLTLKLFQA